jgi:hypothetical protein
MEVALIRDPAELPEPYDREEHRIIAVALCDNTANDDPLDDRFTVTFTTASGSFARSPSCLGDEGVGRGARRAGARTPLARRNIIRAINSSTTTTFAPRLVLA